MTIVLDPVVNRSRTLLLMLVDAVFIGCLCAIPAIWLLNPLRLHLGSHDWKIYWGLQPVLVMLLLLTLRVAIKTLRPGGRQPVKGLLEYRLIQKLMLSVSMTLLCLYAFEGVLALAGYKISMAPVVFELNNAKGETERSEGYFDPELRFRFRKGELYHGRMINSLGYRDREVDPRKAPGTIRVICMGDSVTAQGEPGYSQLLHDLLTAAPPTTNAWEAFNMAVYGYSSMQGLRVFQLETRHLQPDIVTLYYGWNDHWLDMQTDRNDMAVKVRPAYGRLYNKLKHKRIVMLLSQVVSRSQFEVTARKKADFRVPPDDYVKVLTEFVKEIRAVGATPILITAPRRDVFPTKNLFPEEAAKLSFNKVHDQYADLTRQVAGTLGVDLLDLHQRFADPKYDAFFLPDGIHFTQEGLVEIARAIDAAIRAMQPPAAAVAP